MVFRTCDNVSLAPLSAFKIGGKARFFVEVKTPEELVKTVKRWVALRQAQGKNPDYRIFAGGSNVVFPDDGLDSLVIRVLGGRIKVRGYKLTVDSGVFLSDVIKKAISLGFRGLETLSGIPGTIGGAVFGSAGAYGRSISEVVEKVEVLIPKLRKSQIINSKSQTFDRRWISNAECKFGYRESIFKKLSGSPSTSSGNSMSGIIILRVVLRLEKGDRRALEKRSREIIRIREKKYKPGLRCPGSFFKNVLVKEVSRAVFRKIDASKIIEGKIPEGYLLEQVGAKGMRMGGIYIADFHGNLFINKGKGRAEDVRKLAKILKDKVKKKFGIELEEEIRYF